MAWGGEAMMLYDMENHMYIKHTYMYMYIKKQKLFLIMIYFAMRLLTTVGEKLHRD